MSIRLIRRSALAALCVAVLTLSATPDTAHADGRLPMLMDGKETLYRKVLTRPNARIASDPGAEGTRDTTTFSVMFVYGETEANGETWLEIGSDSAGTVLGWVPATATAEWRQTMTLAFTNPAGRHRTLLFRDRDGLEEILSANDLLVRAETFREQIRRNRLPDDAPVISIEPENYVDPTSEFYLLPILDAEEVYLDSGFPMTLLRVTSVTDRPEETEEEDTPPPPTADPGGPGDLKVAVTFVIDATTSMGPYIEQVRTSVRSIYEKIEKAGVADKISFGLVAYRDNIEKVPGLEYTSRVYANPNEVSSGDEFLEKVTDLAPAAASSVGFEEDAYAGIDAALSSIDWSGYGARYIILVTDAGAREGDDPLSGTGISSAEMQKYVRERGIYLSVMHLRTAAGQSNHRAAEMQYRALSRFGPTAGSNLYYPVEAGSLDSFGSAIENLAGGIIENIEDIRDGAVADPEELERRRRALDEATTEEERARKSLEYNAALVGLAIRLEFLGAKEGEQVPDVFEAWLADRSFRDPDLPVVEVRLLLNKNQLSDLQQTLTRVIDASEDGQISPDRFFDSVKAAAAAMGRDADQISNAETLADTGLIGEYLEGLPYRSTVMNVSQDVWTSWGVGQQQQFIDILRSKARLYARFHDDTDNWVLLNPDAPAGEAVYPIPLDALP